MTGKGRGTGRRAVSSTDVLPCIAIPASHFVMPGLVPGIHVPPPPRPFPARTAMPQDVDARNKSGHDGGGERGEEGNNDGHGDEIAHGTDSEVREPVSGRNRKGEKTSWNP